MARTLKVRMRDDGGMDILSERPGPYSYSPPELDLVVSFDADEVKQLSSQEAHEASATEGPIHAPAVESDAPVEGTSQALADAAPVVPPDETRGE